MKKKTYLFIVLVVILSSILPIYSSVFANQNNMLVLENVENEKVDILIYDADYGDYDADNNDDDVQCSVDLIFSSSFPRKKFDMYIFLYLPNGIIYGYGLSISTFLEHMSFHLIFHNQAYVAGDYAISVKLYLGPKWDFYASSYVIFDPPTEEEPDAEPFLSFRLR